MPIRVVVVDDQALVRAGFRMILDTEDDIQVVGEASDGLEAVDLVERRVRQALDCGVDGVVSSPLEAARVREIVTAAGRPDFLIVTPGVRPAGADKGDQQRVATPAEALYAGATHLVVARPVIGAEDPVQAAVAIIAEMGDGPVH